MSKPAKAAPTPHPDPSRVLDQCALDLIELELTNCTPADTDELQGRRRERMAHLREAAGAALRFGAERRFYDFSELERRINGVVEACDALQRRPLDWASERLQAYPWPADEPFDNEQAWARVKAEAADRWRSDECSQLVRVVYDALAALNNIWVAIGPNPAAAPLNPADLPPLISASHLARATGVNKAALDSALRRHAEKHDDCRIEQDNPRPTEPRFMYRVADVWPIVQKLRDNQRATST
jgi:hypothetical protein